MTKCNIEWLQSHRIALLRIDWMSMKLLRNDLISSSGFICSPSRSINFYYSDVASILSKKKFRV